jgi:hypothetical protein
LGVRYTVPFAELEEIREDFSLAASGATVNEGTQSKRRLATLQRDLELLADFLGQSVDAPKHNSWVNANDPRLVKAFQDRPQAFAFNVSSFSWEVDAEDASFASILGRFAWNQLFPNIPFQPSSLSYRDLRDLLLHQVRHGVEGEPYLCIFTVSSRLQEWLDENWSCAFQANSTQYPDILQELIQQEVLGDLKSFYRLEAGLDGKLKLHQVSSFLGGLPEPGCFLSHFLPESKGDRIRQMEGLLVGMAATKLGLQTSRSDSRSDVYAIQPPPDDGVEYNILAKDLVGILANSECWDGQFLTSKASSYVVATVEAIEYYSEAAPGDDLLRKLRRMSISFTESSVTICPLPIFAFHFCSGYKHTFRRL